MPEKKRLKQYFRWILLAILLLAGNVMLGAQWIDSPFWKSVVEHLGTAVVIASFLGLTIDWWLKKQITEDVFSAAIGYELPEDLRTEIRAVYGNKILCEDHAQTVDIEDLQNGFVKLTVGTERRFKNIAQTKQPLSVSIATDEWDVPGHPSKIIELAYEKDGGRTAVYPGGDCDFSDRPVGPKACLKSPLQLRPQEAVTVFAQISETKPLNGDHFYSFIYATQRPRVTVRAPGFTHAVHFAHRDEPHISKYSGTTTLDGLLLPSQNIRVRWWKEKSTSRSGESS